MITGPLPQIAISISSSPCLWVEVRAARALAATFVVALSTEALAMALVVGALPQVALRTLRVLRFTLGTGFEG